MLLTITMAATNPLLYALRVPGKIIVYHQTAELQIKTLSTRFRCNHDGRSVLELFHQSCAYVCRTRPRDAVFSIMAAEPVVVYPLGRIVVVRPA
jgi:hypothetical protein